MKGIVKVGMEDGRRVIYQSGNKLHLAIKEECQGGIIRTRRVKAIEFIPLDEMEEMGNNGGLLEKDIVYLDGSYEWQRGIVIGRMGSTLFIRKKGLFDGEDLDRKEKITIDSVMGIVKDKHEQG